MARETKKQARPLSGVVQDGLWATAKEMCTRESE